ncbi:dirigent protein 5-like [Oryza brachyantha]|uniref:Dirigent protein n=1 Tax=Oryza brachyantha TaxID=4533 RepID=J3MND2_ORYBR|nr:dirigent protein 5-like [Oryza brachyantha]
MATWSKASLIVAAAVVLVGLSSASGAHGGRRGRSFVSSYGEPCKEMRLYLHDIIYDYSNSTSNSTSAAATKPTALSTAVSRSGYFFGEVVVFNDPVTEGKALPPALEETAVRAQGLYLYDKKEAPNAWFAFSIVFNSTGRHGTLNLMGADLMSEKTRDVSVVGGTGDFFMARGVATLRTDEASSDLSYFRLQMDIKLYECYA